MPGKNAPETDNLGTSMFEEPYDTLKKGAGPTPDKAMPVPRMDRVMPMEKNHDGASKPWKPKGRR